MRKRKLRFFLDFGMCFWEVDGTGYCLSPNALPLSADVQREVNQYIKEYDQAYNGGCPPSEGWTIEDCKQFNAETKRILNLVAGEIKDQFIICQEQENLTEDPEILAEIYKDRRAFMNRQMRERQD